MQQLNLSVADLFQRAFGIGRGKPYDGEALNESAIQEPEYEYNQDGNAEGTEFLTVREQINARLADGRPLFMPIRIGGVLLPNEPTIRLGRRKRIAKRQMAGSRRKGTVKELVSAHDWEIVIRGVAVNTKSTLYFPEDQVAAIAELEQREEALEIECALTSLLGIYSIVIERIDLPEMVGIQHAQAYELKCLSDEPFVLTIQ
jgi:hypothetical protein